MSKCGHVNKHSRGVDGKPDNLECHLEAGHSGPHEAYHFESTTQLSPMLTEEEQNKFEIVEKDDGKTYYEGKLLRHWTDMAGTPTNEIIPGSPGVQLENADHLFGVDSSAQVKELQNELNELRALVNRLANGEGEKEASKKANTKKANVSS